MYYLRAGFPSTWSFLSSKANQTIRIMEFWKTYYTWNPLLDVTEMSTVVWACVAWVWCIPWALKRENVKTKNNFESKEKFNFLILKRLIYSRAKNRPSWSYHPCIIMPEFLLLRADATSLEKTQGQNSEGEGKSKRTKKENGLRWETRLSPIFRLSLAPTICPRVSEMGSMGNIFVNFFFPDPSKLKFHQTS